MDTGTLLDIGLVLVFVLVGGVFAATEIALVSLRETQLDKLAAAGGRGARVADLARDPNRFLSAVQIGVTVAGFFSAAFGASRISPDFVDAFTAIGVPGTLAPTISLVLTTLVIAYCSLVLGELVPKRLALQKSAGFAMVLAPPLGRFATLMTPVIWLLSVSTNALVRLLGGDPDAKNEQMAEDEIRGLIAGHEEIPADERAIVEDVFSAGDRSVKEAMTPRRDVTFLAADLPLADALPVIRDHPYSRYPVIGTDSDDVIGYLHVRDLIDIPSYDDRAVGDLARDILGLPASVRVLPAMAQMRSEGVHIALVIDEYGGTDGIVTLEDVIEELVGEIRDEYDAPEDARHPVDPGGPVDAGLTIEEFAGRTGVAVPDGPYETIGGYVLAQLGRLAEPGDRVTAEGAVLEVVDVEDRRITAVRLVTPRPGPAD